MNKKEWKKWLYWFSFAIAVITFFKVINSVTSIFEIFGNFFSVTAPFLMAILLAYILYIPCKKIEGIVKSSKNNFIKKHFRGISVFITYLITILAIFIIINIVIPNIITSVKDLIQNVPNYYNSTIDYLKNIDEESIFSKINAKEYVEQLQQVDIIKEIVKWINLENINSYIQGIVGTTGIIFDAFVTIVVSVYMLMERDQIKRFLARLLEVIFSKKVNDSLVKYFRKTNSIFFSYISGQIIDAIVVGIIIGIALTLMKVKYGILLGFLVGLFNIIPYFGAIFAVVLTIIITIFTGGITQAIAVAIVIIVLQQIDANIINPKILGTSLNLSPILVIFSVTVGGSYFGVLGMFLGVPAIAFIKLLITNFIEYRTKVKFEQTFN